MLPSTAAKTFIGAAAEYAPAAALAPATDTITDTLTSLVTHSVK
jgi:hypothetical protein